MNNYKFETLQIHVGKKSQTLLPMPALSLFTPPHRMCSTILPMPPPDLGWLTRETSTVV